MKSASRLLVVVVVLQGMILLGQWTGGSALSPAQAQIPDAGGQRMQMIDELKGLNQKMEKMMGLLESGKVQVRLSNTDEKK